MDCSEVLLHLEMKCGVGHSGQNYQKCPRKLKNGHTISYRGSKGVAPGVKMGGAGGQNGWRRGPGAKGVASGVKKGGAGGQNGWFLAQESWGQKGWRQGVNRAPPFLLVQHFFLNSGGFI